MNAPLGALESLYYFILQYGGVEDESRLTTGQQKRGSLLLYYRAENESTYKCVLRSAFQHARKFPKTISPCVVLYNTWRCFMQIRSVKIKYYLSRNTRNKCIMHFSIRKMV